MIDFSKRSNEKEYLDDLASEGEDLTQNLRELKFINTWLGGNNVTLSGLDRVFPKNTKNPIHIADLGCGGGDILQLISSWGKYRKQSLALTGIDANPFIIEYAKRNTSKEHSIDYKTLNIFSSSFAALPFDVINCTLFCHHFTNEELIQLFSQLKKQTATAIVINDLHRHWFAYYSIHVLTYLFSKSYMVKNDAKLSVLRGFSKKELISVIEKSGFTDFSIRWKWAFRWEVVIKN